MNYKKSWKIDVPVLCIFFARPEVLEITFERIKRARPKTILLWQDGPRNNHPDDIKNIEKCRRIVDNIDWECQIYKNYHKKNMGCDPSTFLAQKWAFSIVDKCIILEDDIVVSNSFFDFCKELLDRYEDDERIDRICGQTLYQGVDDKRYSYFFSRSGSSWGWATWKRVADTWEEKYDFLSDSYVLDLARYRFGNKRFKYSVERAKRHSHEGIPYWEHIIGFRTTLQSGLVIYPKVNLVENIGATVNATHAPDNIEELPKDIRYMLEIQKEELTFPLKHPKYIIEDYHYFEKMMKVINPNILVKIRRKIEHQIRKVIIKLMK